MKVSALATSEDDDFCLRAVLAGYLNLICGDVFIHHYGSRTFIGNGIDCGSSLSGNRKIFIEKWSGGEVAQRFWWEAYRRERQLPRRMNYSAKEISKKQRHAYSAR